MAATISIHVKDLKLDLTNYRTVPQPEEIQAVQTMVSIRPEWFWALMESLLDDGYLPTENILVLKSGAESELIVKEGNRRIAALKLIYEYLPINSVDMPAHITSKIRTLTPEWKTANREVPCAVYNAEEAGTVDKIVTLAHGKGEQAGRDGWTAVARARHNRDANSASEPALDLLEKYLKNGKNIIPAQIERWSGDYPLTVLDEAIKRVAPRFGASNAPDLAKRYPIIEYRDVLETILRDIGLKIIRFETIRDKKKDFGTEYGLPTVTPSGNSDDSPSQTEMSAPSTAPSVAAGNQPQGSLGRGPSKSPQDTMNVGEQGGQVSGQATCVSGKKIAAVAVSDPKVIKRSLKKFRPLGNNRQKVVTLRDEAINLTIEKNPIAFCFLLRSMFEISAKAYCEDHKASGGPSCKKADGQDRHLVDILRDITNDLTKQKTDQVMVRILHGALTELAKKEGILSITSMNQLVHNPSFSVVPSDICILFGNIFPLLEAMNR